MNLYIRTSSTVFKGKCAHQILIKLLCVDVSIQKQITDENKTTNIILKTIKLPTIFNASLVF